MENELQDWQREILERYSIDDNPFMLRRLPLKDKQKKMIEELLFPTDSHPYWVEEEYKRILERVLGLGFYVEGDREALNYARECYLKGKNWIK